MQPTIVCGHNWLVSFSWKRKMQIGSLQMLSLLTCTYVEKLEYIVESSFKHHWMCKVKDKRLPYRECSKELKRLIGLHIEKRTLFLIQPVEGKNSLMWWYAKKEVSEERDWVKKKQDFPDW